MKLRLSLLRYLPGDAADDFDLQFQFARESHQRNHDLRTHLDAFALHLCGSFKNCARLHLGNLRINDAEPATAMAEHRIEFVQLVDTPRDFFRRHAELVGEFVLLRGVVRQKLVERWIEKANRGWQAP